MERVVGRLQLLIDRVKTASYGYAPLFALNRVKEDDLDRLIEFDQALVDEVGRLDEAIGGLERRCRRTRASRKRSKLSATCSPASTRPSAAARMSFRTQRNSRRPLKNRRIHMARIIDVIQAPDQGLNQMVVRVPQTGSGDFRIGSQVIVRESQAAVFFRDGKALDIFGPGRHTITTANIPLLVDLIRLAPAARPRSPPKSTSSTCATSST